MNRAALSSLVLVFPVSAEPIPTPSPTAGPAAASAEGVTTPVAPDAPAAGEDPAAPVGEVQPAGEPGQAGAAVPDPVENLAGIPLQDRPPVEGRSDAELGAELSRLQAEAGLRQARLEAQLAEARAATAVAQAELERNNALVSLEAMRRDEDYASRLAALTAERDAAVLSATTEEARAKAAQMALATTRAEFSQRTVGMEAELERLQQERAAALVADRQPVYLDRPLQEDGTLVISDRRIPLNGPIVEETAGFVASRIQFFNNQDPSKPIFLVIDSCPGGSVTAGYQILNAMESSEATVHVVVKGTAASMAAMITTLAEESYMLPNARLLHHQMSWAQEGNISQQRDNIQSAMEWWSRIGGLAAARMNLTLDEFIEQMYEHSVDGDWTEFGERAQQLHWVKHVVRRVHETAQLEHPSRQAASPGPSITALAGTGGSPTASNAAEPVGMTITRAAFEDQPAVHLPEQIDERGRPYVQLPHGGPDDQYYLFDPHGYYRLP